MRPGADRPAPEERIQMSAIGEIREKIALLDEQILTLVSERLKCAGDIGRLKRSSSTPLRNYTVEASVIEHARQVCAGLGVDSQLGAEIAKMLIRASLSVQSSSSIQVYGGKTKRILMVGGNGRMGVWFSNFFNTQGHEVTVHDIQGTSPFRTAQDLAEAAREAEVVLLSTPISATPSLLRTVLDSGTGALVMDGCSLKSPLLSELKRGVDAGMRVTSIHAMFGPGATTLADQNMIICDCGSRAAAEEASSLFSDTCLSITTLDVERHDEIMAYVLGMAHAMNIALFSALSAGGRKCTDLSRFASTTFRKQMQTTADVASENPVLYYEIQNLNRHRETVFSTLIDSLDELRKASMAGSSNEFVNIMERGREYFRGYSNE